MIYICEICGKGFGTVNQLKGHKSKCGKVNDVLRCPICNKECRGKQALSTHTTWYHSDKDGSSFNIKQDNLFCKYCGLQYDTLNSLKNHEAWCELNPNHRSKDIFKTDVFVLSHSHEAWNKGLTKDTDDRIKKHIETYKKNQLLGLHKSNSHSHTDETKELLRQKALSNPYQRVCKKTVDYIKTDGSVVKLDSTYEVRTAEILDRLGIEWIRPESLVWVDKNNVTHHYFPDFYLVKFDLYLDPKNEYCFNVQKEKIEYIKNHYYNVVFLEEDKITEDFIKTLVSMV